MAKTTVDTLLVKIQGDMGQLEKELKKVQAKTNKTSSEFRKSFARMGGAIANTAKNITLAGAAIGTAFGAIAIKKVINVGSEIEGLQVRLKSLFGSAESGKKAFNELAKFASKVPFSLQEIQQGAGSLAVVADDAEHLSRLLTITGNAAALTGLDFATASGQIQRAFAGGAAASDLFRERGLNALLGFKAGATSTAEETAKVFEDNLGANGKFGKTTDELAQTLSGTLSMIGDKVFNFQRIIADEKFFGEVKKQFEALNSHLADNQHELDKLAKMLGTELANALKIGVDGLIVINENLETFKTLIKAIMALGLIKFFLDLAKGVGLVGLAKAFAKLPTPIKIAIGGIALMTTAMTTLLNKIKNTKEETKALATELEKTRMEMQRGANDSGIQDIFGSPFQTTSNQSRAKGPDFSKSGQLGEDKIPAFLGKPDLLASENEEMEKQIINLDNLAKVQSIQNEAEREFQELLMQSNIQHPENVKLLRERFDVIKELEQAEVDREGAEKTRIHNLEQTRSRMAELKSITEEFRTEEEVLIEKQERLNELINEFGINAVPNAGVALQKLQQEIDGLNPTVKILEDNFDRAFDGIAQSIADSMTEGKDAMESFRDVAKAALNSIIRDFIRLQMTQMQTSSGGGSFLSSIVGGIGSIFGGMFGGSAGITSSGGLSGNSFTGSQLAASTSTGTASFMMGGRAGGGRIAPDMPTLVGERGAELFVPNTSGKIVPKSGLSNALGGGQTVVNQTINVSAGVAQTIRAEMMNMLPSFKQETIAAVAESRLRGGQFASAFTGA